MKLPFATFSDNDGFIERECPKCLFTYKIRATDWENKVFEYEVFCPKCKNNFSSDMWWTEEQISLLKMLLSDRRFDDSDEKVFVNHGLKNRFEGICGYEFVAFKKNIGYSFSNNPVGAKRSWVNDIECSSCGTQFKSVGFAFTCPCCAYDNTYLYYGNLLRNSQNMIDSVREIKDVTFSLYGEDEAEIIENELCYKAAENMARGFEAYCQSAFRIVGASEYSDMKFQSLDKAEKYFGKIYGRGITENLCVDDREATETVFATVFSFLSKKRKENTPHINMQDVYAAIRTLIIVSENISSFSFKKGVK